MAGGGRWDCLGRGRSLVGASTSAVSKIIRRRESDSTESTMSHISANRPPKIHYPAGSELKIGVPNESTLEKRYPAGGESAEGFHPALGWSHYRSRQAHLRRAIQTRKSCSKLLHKCCGLVLNFFERKIHDSRLARLRRGLPAVGMAYLTPFFYLVHFNREP